MHPFIELRNIQHGYSLGKQNINLFCDLNLKIEQGESVALTGSSGAGKSTLLLLMAGLEQARSGALAFHNGVRNGNLIELKQSSGFIFQQFHLLPELDALNNLALPLKLRGNREALDQAHHWLALVGLAGRGKHRPSQLSGGEQQRIAIARALITQPKFIFADEPTGNLDETTSAGIVELLFDLVSAQNSALILVTHDLMLAHRCQRVLQLQQGQLHSINSEQILAAKPQLATAMLARG